MINGPAPAKVAQPESSTFSAESTEQRLNPLIKTDFNVSCQEMSPPAEPRSKNWRSLEEDEHILTEN